MAFMLSPAVRGTLRLVKPRPGVARMMADSAAAGLVPRAGPSEAAVKTFARVFGGADKRPVILFDGECIFCNRGVDTILRLDLNRRLRWVDESPQHVAHIHHARTTS
jgi:hypothetical protein